MDQFDWKEFAHQSHDDNSFSLHPPSFKMETVVKVLRKMSHDAEKHTVTIDEFLELALLTMRTALWADVQHAIACSGGPELPELIWLQNGTRTEFFNAPILPGVKKVKLDDGTVFMLVTVAMCFEARTAFLCKGLLKNPSDWWLRLLLWKVIHKLNVPKIAATYD